MIDDCRLLEHGGLVRLIFGGNPDLSGMIKEWKNTGMLEMSIDKYPISNTQYPMTRGGGVRLKAQGVKNSTENKQRETSDKNGS